MVELRRAGPPPAPSPLDTHLANFHHRVLADALLEATSSYWLRRADTFDTVGTPACDDIALACRRHAELIADTGLDAESEQLLAAITGQTGRL